MAITQDFSVFNYALTAVRLASTANIAGIYINGPLNDGIGSSLLISGSSLSIDSVDVNVGDSILLTAQTASYQNGIYLVESIYQNIVTLRRRPDFQSVSQMQPGFYCNVKAGTSNAAKVFTVTEPAVQFVGVSGISVAAVSGGGGGGGGSGNLPVVIVDSNVGRTIMQPNKSYTCRYDPGSGFVEFQLPIAGTAQLGDIVELLGLSNTPWSLYINDPIAPPLINGVTIGSRGPVSYLSRIESSPSPNGTDTISLRLNYILNVGSLVGYFWSTNCQSQIFTSWTVS